MKPVRRKRPSCANCGYHRGQHRDGAYYSLPHVKQHARGERKREDVCAFFRYPLREMGAR